MFRRVEACVFALHAVQLARLQNGVREHLCRMADIVQEVAGGGGAIPAREIVMRVGAEGRCDYGRGRALSARPWTPADPPPAPLSPARMWPAAWPSKSASSGAARSAERLRAALPARG